MFPLGCYYVSVDFFEIKHFSSQDFFKEAFSIRAFLFLKRGRRMRGLKVSTVRKGAEEK
jgi:hypothetical protein